jgi:fused signal recognition particle receptor
MFKFFKKVAAQFSGDKPDWDELEAILIQADFGAKFAVSFVEELKKKEGFLSAGAASDIARRDLEAILTLPAPTPPGHPIHVILMVGVNGAGKTTTCAKLAAWHTRHGKRVRLVAADTFRAAAIEQLQLWGTRLGVPVTAGAYGSDPAAAAFSGYEAAVKEGAQILIVDTAGRQHNKHNLMQELGKVSRALTKCSPGAPHETLLVVDTNTGGNALVQAREFAKTVPLTGVVGTKLDGSGLGGSLVAIRHECGLSPRWMGLGEGVDDFRPFDPAYYLDKLFSA